MSHPKQEDALYSFIRSRVRNAIDLEYAIRASELVSPGHFKELRKLEQSIIEVWINHGATLEEIRLEDLLDFSWDTLQIGFPLTRRHGRLLHSGLFKVIDSVLPLLKKEFSADSSLLDIPAANFYRICDLLSGSDIVAVMNQLKEGLQASRTFSKEDDVPLKFFQVAMREPIHLHPAFSYGLREDGPKKTFRLEVDLAGDFDHFSWRQQLNEFQYQYALHRSNIAGNNTMTATLIQDFLEKDFEGVQSDFEVPGITSLLPLLVGIYCWDCHKREHETQDAAFNKAMTFHPVGSENLRKFYRIAAKRIEDMENRFRMFRRP